MARTGPGLSESPVAGSVHAAAFGFTKPEWVLRPLAELHVERFLLLEMPGVDRARRELAAKGVDIDAELGQAVGRVDTAEVDLWDPGAVAGVLIAAAHAVERESHGPLWVNISCGPNPWCVGATLASMFAPIQVYHAARTGLGILRIPSMRHDPPTHRELRVLATLPSDGSWMSGALLKRKLDAVGYFPGKGGASSRKIRNHLYLQTSLRRQLGWQAIVQEKRGGRWWYGRGPCGGSLLAMFPTTTPSSS